MAAFYVFLFHLQIRTPVFGDGLGAGIINEGAIGMTMFFMLSGFILTHVYHAPNIDIKKYFVNRIARVYPIYFTAAILAAPWLLKELSNELGSQPVYAVILSGLVLVVFGLLLIHAWLPQTFAFWNNSASWSISNEAFFYSVFPFAKHLIMNLSRNHVLAVYTLLLCISVLIPLSTYVFDNTPSPSFSLFYANPMFRLPEFLCGIATYILMKRILWTAILRRFLLFVIVAATALITVLGPMISAYTLHNWLVVPAVSSALILLFQRSDSRSFFWSNGFFVWLGKISYCFYSFQFHVLEGLRVFLDINLYGGYLYAILSTIILLLVSGIAHHTIEEPARIWLRNRFNKMPAVQRAAAN